MEKQKFLRAFWQLAKPYWVSEQRGKGLALLATVVGLALMLVWLEVQFNQWNNDFYNTFQDKDQAEFFRQLGKFTLLAVIFIVTTVYRQYFQQMLMIEWRTWLTDRLLKNWSADRAYYRMSLLDKGTDNPDQRIAEDLKLFVDYTLSLGVGLLSAVATLVVFVGILWTLSGALELMGVTVHGYLVWIGLIYAIVGTWMTHRVGRPLVDLNFNQQRFEADFRFALVRFRENSEGIALYRGETEELKNFGERFAAVIDNWWSLMVKQKQLGWFTSFYGQLAIIFPYVVVAPRFFSGAMQLGGIFQTASAFGQVQGALSWFINAYTQFATWKATVDRLAGFMGSIEYVRAEAERLDGEREEIASEDLAMQGLALSLPQGKPLLAPTTLQLKRGEAVLVSGPVGRGQIHAVPRAGRHLALLDRQDPPAEGRAAAVPAAEALSSRGRAEARRVLSGRRRDFRRCRSRGGAARGRPRAPGAGNCATGELGAGPIRRRAAAPRVRACAAQQAGLAVSRRGNRLVARGRAGRALPPAQATAARNDRGVHRPPREPRAIPSAPARVAGH